LTDSLIHACGIAFLCDTCETGFRLIRNLSEVRDTFTGRNHTDPHSRVNFLLRSVEVDCNRADCRLLVRDRLRMMGKDIFDSADR
jgi:hypothetical protein